MASLKNQVNELRLQDKLGKQKFHENIEKLHEPLTDTIEDTSRDIIKTKTETSIKSNETLEILNNKRLEIVRVSGIITTYLISASSKITNLENTSQFKSVKHSTSNRVNDVLIHNTIPVFPYSKQIVNISWYK